MKKLLILTASLMMMTTGLSAARIFTGTDQGIWAGNDPAQLKAVWTGAAVNKILPVTDSAYFLTAAGVLYTRDGQNFEARNNGLPVKSIKHFNGREITMTQTVQALKDLEADPENPANMVVAAKDGVFYSTNGGLKWLDAGIPGSQPGVKSVAITSRGGITLYAGHPFKGVYRKKVARGGWENISEGLTVYGKANEEVSDILATVTAGRLSVIAAHNFMPRFYSFQEASRKWTEFLRLTNDFELVENLQPTAEGFSFQTRQGRLFVNNGTIVKTQPLQEQTAELGKRTGQNPRCFSASENGRTLALQELWMYGTPVESERMKKASGRNGIYLAAWVARKPAKLQSVLTLMSNTGLNSVVIDMKDDWGNLRFKPRSELLRKKGRFAGAIDLETFIPAMKKQGIYMIARLVLFQDKVLYDYNGHEYAVKDGSAKGGAWQGTKKNKDGSVKEIQEFWVDPYCEFAWEYNAAIARELIERGFDEIQFDYVRFPTDGDNLGNTYHSWRAPGMDKESALLSFLTYMRENIQAPISLDIYGANGWYRTGARTGQDVELFDGFVDAVCPMFYPSHFEPGFMLYPPFEDRTYRIYYYGSLRNLAIARGRIAVRPYIQAFAMKLSYDRQYYGPGYVANQIKGSDDGAGQGYTFWNMGVKYEVVPKAYELLNK